MPWLSRHSRSLEIYILKWGVGALKFLGRGTMALDLVRWFPHPRIEFKFDTAHPVGCSHHQKIVVIDRKFAVCGGIDMTDGRWDTRAHLERGQAPQTTARLELRAVARPHDDDGGSGRRGDGRTGPGPVAASRGKTLAALPALEGSPWPDGLEPHFENVEIGISRTRAEYADQPAIREIEQLFKCQIACAKRFIYAESQYFASRRRRRSHRQAAGRTRSAGNRHRCTSSTADGWVEATAMDPARAVLTQAIRQVDRAGRFHLYMPYSGETPIYVHAKLMIVDDGIPSGGLGQLQQPFDGPR